MWNYRILHQKGSYWIAEVYYDDDGEPRLYSGDVGVWEASLEDVEEELEKMKKALDKPVLEAWP